MSEFEIIKLAGPAGMGLFAGYLFIKEIFSFVRNNKNGSNVANTITTQAIFKIIVELKSEAKKHTELLEKLVDKPTPT